VVAVAKRFEGRPIESRVGEFPDVFSSKMMPPTGLQIFIHFQNITFAASVAQTKYSAGIRPLLKLRL